MMTQQMQLSFDSSAPSPRVLRRQRRLRRARWWFDQMRQVVDRALDREPVRPGRPEQIHFSLGRGASR